MDELIYVVSFSKDIYDAMIELHCTKKQFIE